MHQISFIVCQILFPYITSSYIIVTFMCNHTFHIMFNHLCYMLINTIYLTYHTWFFKITNHTSCVMHQNSFINARAHLSFTYLLEYLKIDHALACSIYHTSFINGHLLTSSNPINMCPDFIHHAMFQTPSLIQHSSQIMFYIGYHISAKIKHHRFNERCTIYNVPQSFITHHCSHTWFSHIIMHCKWKTYIIFSSLFSWAMQLKSCVSYHTLPTLINIIHGFSSFIKYHTS